jgi:HK97 family phage major capsid protein
VPTLTELFNEWAAAQAKAREFAGNGDQDAFNAAWNESETKRKAWENLKKVEDADKALDSIRPTIADLRDPNDATQNQAPSVPAAVANQNPSNYIQLAPGRYVPFATNRTEGFNRRSPAAVQLPEIMARYEPGSDLWHQANLQREAFSIFMRKGENAREFNDARLRQALNALQEDTDSEGGYLVPADERMELIHDPGAPGGVTRGISRVLQTSRDGGTFPVATTVTWGAIAEEATPSDSDPVMSQVPFTIRKSGVNMTLSEELLADSAVNLPQFIGRVVDETSGRYEDQQAVEGDGSTEPLGLRTTGATQGDVGDVTDLITLAAPTLAEMLNAYFEVPAQFRGPGLAWHTTSSFMARVTAISASGGQLWLLPNGSDRPGFSILGAPVVMFDGTGWDNAAAIAANEEVGAIGNFNWYWFVDRMGVVIRRDDSVAFRSDQVAFKARKRYDSFFAENGAFLIIKGAGS